MNGSSPGGASGELICALPESTAGLGENACRAGSKPVCKAITSWLPHSGTALWPAEDLVGRWLSEGAVG